MDDLTNPQSDRGLDTTTDDIVPPASEDWVRIKPVPPSISNIQQVIPEWVPTQPGEPQTTSNEQGPPRPPTEEEVTPSALQSDSVSGEEVTPSALQPDSVSGEEVTPSAPQSDSNQLGTDESEGSRETERESGGDQDATVSSEQGEECAASVATTGKLSWDSLGGAKKRFNYDILPKVSSKLYKCDVLFTILPLAYTIIVGDVLSWITC